MIFEACIENATLLDALIDKNIDRVELCDNLAVGGTTVSAGVLNYVKGICDKNNIDIAYMIRPRGGNFVYNDYETEIIKNDILYAADQGIRRFVFGALTDVNELDINVSKTVTDYAMSVTDNKAHMVFHMAFDNIENEDERIKSIEVLSKIGYKTILTHGSNKGNDILENVDKLKLYIKEAEKFGIEIMPGGGLNYNNLPKLLEKLDGIRSVHGTKIVKI